MATNPTIKVTTKDEATAALRQIEGQVKRLNDSARTLGQTLGTAISVGAVVEGFRRIVGALDDLDEASQALGVTAVALAEFRQAASDSGVAAEKFDVGITRLNVKMADAAGGGKESSAAFKALGVELRSGSGQLKNTEEILGEVANKFQSYRDGAAKSALAVELFGKAGAAMIPFLNQGAEGLRKFSGVTEESVIAARKLQAQFDQMKINAQSFAISLAKDVIPFISKMIEELNAARSAAGGFIGALKLLGTTSAETLADPGEQVQILSAELRKATELQKAFADGTRQASLATLQDNEDAIKALQTRLKFLQELQRNRALANYAADYSNEGRAALKIPPIIEKEIKLHKEKKESISESQNALARYVELLDRESEKLDELTEKERVLKFLQENPSVDTSQTRELLFAQAERVELARQEKAIRDEVTRITKQQLDYEKSLRDEVLQLSGVTEEQRKVVLAEQLELLIKQSQEIEKMGGKPILTPEQIERATKGIAGIRDEVKQTNDTVERFGLVFTSALGEFIKSPNQNIKSFFKALEQDISQLITQILVVEPLIKRIRAAAAGATSASGDIDFGKLFEGILGSLDVGTPYVQKTGIYQLHKGERVVPAKENKSGRWAGNMNVTFVLPPGGYDRATQNQIAADAIQVYSNASRRLN